MEEKCLRGTFATWPTIRPYLSNSRMGAEHRPLWRIYGCMYYGSRRHAVEATGVLSIQLAQSEDAYPCSFDSALP
jgi:hypothetical protein